MRTLLVSAESRPHEKLVHAVKLLDVLAYHHRDLAGVDHLLGDAAADERHRLSPRAGLVRRLEDVLAGLGVLRRLAALRLDVRRPAGGHGRRRVIQAGHDVAPAVHRRLVGAAVDEQVARQGLLDLFSIGARRGGEEEQAAHHWGRVAIVLGAAAGLQVFWGF